MRSRSMQRLTDQTRARYPGVVVYGIGDDAHRRSRSAHNEDDTPGSLPDQDDPDSIPEHRAIDVMLGPAFTRDQAHDYCTALATHPDNRRRLTYILFDGWRWSVNTGWRPVPITSGDPHHDHPHVNGLAAADDDATDWVLDLDAPPEDDDPMKPMLIPLAGKATVFYKEPGHPLRALTDAWAVGAYRAAGAVPVAPAPSARVLVACMGPLDGETTATSITKIGTMG